jgi:hypothetical protein
MLGRLRTSPVKRVNTYMNTVTARAIARLVPTTPP